MFGFDGSASGDTTALVACTVDSPHVFPLGLWRNLGDPRWRVPRAYVHAAVDAAFDTYDVVELACDPWGRRSDIEAWAARHGEDRVTEYPTNILCRMGPACDRVFAAVTDSTVTHNGDRDLAAHVGHCIAKLTPLGDVVPKDRKNSPRKIDAAVAMIVAFDRAVWHAPKGQARSNRAMFKWGKTPGTRWVRS